jgi:hypothetical protein
MDNIPTKASAFILIRRPNADVLCTVEGEDGKKLSLGIPGGKWKVRRDGKKGDAVNWQRLLEREYKEEVNADLPTETTTSGYFEWGSDAFQSHIRIVTVTNDVADRIPVGPVSDLGGKVREIVWTPLKLLENDNAEYPLRPHILVVFRLLKYNPLIVREILRSRVSEERPASTDDDDE